MSGFVTRDIRGVTVTHWVPSADETNEPGERVENIGDFLGQAITAEIAAGGEGSGARLLSAGSIIHVARPHDVVWGSGLNLKLVRPIPPSAKELDYRAVRGPLTRAALLLAGANVPDVLGDPVSLLPEVFPHVREWIDRQRSITIVPNLNDLAEFDGLPNVLSPIAEPWSVVRTIAESEFVVGSSLHAVIIAESLGIPARFLLSQVENPWKYHDYLLATGRSKERFARSVDEALALGGHPRAEPDLDALRSAFPHDLWGVAPAPPALASQDACATLDAVTTLLIEEFDDVDRDDRGGLAMVRALVRLLGAPLVRSYAHRLRSERLEPVAAALHNLVRDHIDELDLNDDPAIEIIKMLADGAVRPAKRVALRDAVGANTRVVSSALDEDRFEWHFNGVGVGPSILRSAVGARAVLLLDGSESPVSVAQLTVSVDYPYFRWALVLRLADIPPGVAHFGLRLDWDTGSGWVRGARVHRTPGLGAPRLMRLRGELGWRLQSVALAERETLDDESPFSGAGWRNVRGSSELTWVAEPATPELSVVVTAHDVAEWLDETLYSILRQGVQSMEVIVVNDHSSDEIGCVLSRFADDSRVLVIDAIDRGGANARDVGASVAGGRFLVFADGDDIVPDGAYEALVDSLKGSNSDIAIGNFNKFSPSEIWRPTRRWGVFDNPGIAMNVRDAPGLLRGRAVWNKVFRRKFWVDESLSFPEVPRSNDIVPMTRALLRAERVDVVDRDVYLYRDRPGHSSMTSQSSSSAGLVSYLTQELECVQLIRADGDPGLLATTTALVVSADGWAHLARAASDGAELPPSIVPLVDAILAELPPEVVAEQPDERKAVFRLLALGRCHAAAAILRHHGAEGGGEAVSLLEGWLEAVEFVPELTSDGETYTNLYKRHVGPAIEIAARGSIGSEIRETLRHALELAPPGLDPVASATLKFAVGSETPDVSRTAMTLLADWPPAEPGSATPDDWLALLDGMEDLTQDQVRLIWRNRIQPLVEAALDNEVVIPEAQWERLVASRRRAVAKHRDRGVRRAAPVVAIYDSFGAAGLSAYRVLNASGVTVDECALRRGRLRLGGPLPAHVVAGHLALHVHHGGETVATSPVTAVSNAGMWRWTTTIDLARVPLDRSSSIVMECFRGREGWFYLRVPMHFTEQAASQVGDHLRVPDSKQSSDGAVVNLTGVPGIRRDVRGVTDGVRGVVRRTLRRVRQVLLGGAFRRRGR